MRKILYFAFRGDQYKIPLIMNKVKSKIAEEFEGNKCHVYRIFAIGLEYAVPNNDLD